MRGCCPFLVLVLFASVAVGAQEVERVATIVGEDITREEIASAADQQARPARLLELIWRRVAPHYISRRGLSATEAEVAEVAAYDREFRRKDRAQRARKLAELERRLANDDLSPEERAHLENFRAILRRMARADLENDRRPPPAPDQRRAFYAPWIEMWKMNKALYDQYGGVVVLTAFGPSAHGARAALIADYESRGLIRFFDPALRANVFALLDARPSVVVPPEGADFTPYWKRPIPPSYFPD